MALVRTFEDAKAKQRKKSGNVVHKGILEAATTTPFFGSRDNPDLPHAKLAQHSIGEFSSAHFHIVDQFQVIVDGRGKLGRHEYAAYSVHFSRAYTPYGPFLADSETGFTHFGLRPHFDPGSQDLPQSLDKLRQVADRDPWQITRPATFPTLQAGSAAADFMLQAIPDIKDEKGLAAYTLSMKPNAKTYAPDPSHGDGQYIVVVKGSLLHDNKEHKAYTLVWVYPNEDPFQIHAGPGGLEGFVLNFPRRQMRMTGASKSLQPATGSKTWQCVCAYIYNEAAGLPEEGIAPDTGWNEVPETWCCPDCNSSKAEFQMIEL